MANHRESDLIEELVDLAVAAPAWRKPELADAAIERLSSLDDAAVNREAERQILRRIARAWSCGWQPHEVARQVRRHTDAAALRLGLRAIAVDRLKHDPSTLDDRWVAQLEALDLPDVSQSAGWAASWANNLALTRRQVLDAMIALLHALDPIYGIPILIPPPGVAASGPTINLTEKSNDPMLARVRALLAQAESTTFEAEAEAFTAKAQELMTRHAIDMAMVAANSRRTEQPGTIRIVVDDPYVRSKSHLLHVVASRSRCHAVLHGGFAMSSVVGFVADLESMEMLYTSLLVQAQAAMRAASASAEAGTRARSRAFRSSFLMAYAQRVGERLDEINRAVVADVETASGHSILPVLAARSEVVEARVNEMFGRLTRSRRSQGVDAAGWASGRLAADRAQLNDRVLSG